MLVHERAVLDAGGSFILPEKTIWVAPQEFVLSAPVPLGIVSSGTGAFLFASPLSGKEGTADMLKPDLKTVQKLAEDYSIVPVCREIYGDSITPIAILRKLAAKSQRYFLLESVEGGEKWGRYSFLGCDPVLRVTCAKGIVRIEETEGCREILSQKPLEVLREILKSYRSPILPDFPPFTGGFAGYFAYSMIGYAEPVLKITNETFADYDVMLFDKILAYDHLKQKLSVIVNIRTDRAEENYKRAEEQIQELIALLRQAEPAPERRGKEEIHFTCSVSKEEYCRMVEKTKSYIRNGDIFQADISRKFESPMKNSLFNAYRVLRTTNPSPYMVYFHTEQEELMSTSPETLVRLQNGKLTTFPVAGSRPRGRNQEEDERLKRELLSDEKELSEHNMLVDLGRNDLGKISRYGSVKVAEYMQVHKYSKIMHICSQVESRIQKDRDGLDAIEAVLPAGTLSGAPKIRACQIIEEIEKEERGIYGGALGYLDFAGNLDTCIAIRMAVRKNGKVSVQAGGGIVADSVPEMEYEESANKAAAVMQAVIRAEEVEEE